MVALPITILDRIALYVKGDILLLQIRYCVYCGFEYDDVRINGMGRAVMSLPAPDLEKLKSF